MEVLEPGRRYVYVSNHASLFDIPAVLAGISDRVAIILKQELTRIPIWGWALKYGHYISIDRANARDAMESLERAVKKVSGNASVLVFAEGTRSLDGTLQPFKRGAFVLAARAGVPIVPVTIKNSFAIMAKGSWTIRPTDIELIIDPPIDSRVEGREAELRLMERVRAILGKNFSE
jgi:1-acyl-sn-glycerol-3-phosphate acyltransferase